MIIIKSLEQINGIRRSSQLAASALNFIEPYIKPGISTLELNDLIEKFIVEHKAIPAPLNYKGFPKAICTSINEVICHGIPSEKDILKEGDIINVDVTTILDGYYGDTSKTFAVGNIKDNAKKLIDITQKCLQAGIEQVFPGNYFGNIGYVIHTTAVIHGFSVVYQFCGHGVGINFHEDPCILHVAEKNSGQKMQSGMVFTIEPMLNEHKPEALVCEIDNWTARTIDGALSAQFEHTILVTDNGFEILTK